MSSDPIDRLLNLIRAEGFEIEAGTIGYSIRLRATHQRGAIVETTAEDPYLAATQLLDAVRARKNCPDFGACGN